MTYEDQMKQALREPLNNIRLFCPGFGNVNGLRLNEFFSHGYALGREDEAHDCVLASQGRARQTRNARNELESSIAARGKV